MKTYIKFLGGALLAAIISVSCTEKFDNPPAPTKTNAEIEQELVRDQYELISIYDLKDRFFYTKYPTFETGGGFGIGETIGESVAIRGKVISNDWHGNVYRSLYIQDETGAIEIKVGLTGLFADYIPGSWVYVKCKGLVLGNYRYNLSLGVTDPSGKYANGYIDLKAEVRNTLMAGEYAGMTQADTLVLNSTNVNQVGNTGFLKENLGRLVRFEGLESVWGTATGDSNYSSTDVYPQYLQQIGSGDNAYYYNWTYEETIAAWKAYEAGTGDEPQQPRPGTGTMNPADAFIDYPTWGFKNTTESYYGTSLFKLGTRYFTVRTSGYSTFALRPVPQNAKTVNLTGILGYYSNSSGSGYKKFQVVLNNYTDVVALD